MTRAPLLVVVLAAAGTAGCVRRTTYDACVADLGAARVSGDAAETARKEAVTQVQALTQQLADAQAATQACEGKVSDLSTASHNLQAQLDESTAMNQQLRDELTRLGKDVDKVLAERGTLSKALDDAKARLDELRKAQAAAETRQQLFRDLAARFKHLVDAGEARVETRRGRLVIEVRDDLLFDEGRSELRSAGKGMLMEVARALQTTPAAAAQRQFLVTTHGDDLEPSRTAAGRGEKADKARRFKTTWELTAARAVTVVEYLVTCGVPPSTLTAGAAGSFDPLDSLPGASATDGRPARRGVEITLLSSDELSAGSPPGAPPSPPPL
jgi:chemotaxis protein MotB